MGNDVQWNLSKDVYSAFVQNHPKPGTSPISLHWELIDTLWHVHAQEYYSVTDTRKAMGESSAKSKEQDVKKTTCSTSRVCRFPQKKNYRAESESAGQFPLPYSTPTPSPFLRRHWCSKKPEFEFRLLLINSLLSGYQFVTHQHFRCQCGC